MLSHKRFRLDDEQRRTPMASEAVERDPEETIGGSESGALMNRAFWDSDLMAQSHDLEFEVKARTKDRTQWDAKREQGSGNWLTRNQGNGTLNQDIDPRSIALRSAQ
jgi:hypothetical protein